MTTTTATRISCRSPHYMDFSPAAAASNGSNSRRRTTAEEQDGRDVELHHHHEGLMKKTTKKKKQKKKGMRMKEKRMMIVKGKKKKKVVKEEEEEEEQQQKRTKVVAVASHFGDVEGWDLVSWAIHVAARTRGSVLVLSHTHHHPQARQHHHHHHQHQPQLHIRGSTGKGSIQARGNITTKLAALKQDCKAKQVKLELRVCNNWIDVIAQASSANATMLVVRPSSKDELLLRDAQKIGNTLTERIPSICTVAIVRDYKVLFYKEKVSSNEYKTSTGFNERKSCEGSKAMCHLSLPHNLSHSRCQGSTQEEEEEEEEEEDEAGGVKICNLGCSMKQMAVVDAGGGGGEVSPRGVLDGIGLSSESEMSSPSNSYCALSSSNSRKGLLLSCISAQEDNPSMSMCKRQHNPMKCMKMLRSSSSFPLIRHPMKLPGTFLDCKLLRSSFKSYVNSLCSTESMSHDPLAPHPAVIDWRYFSYDELITATDHFNPGNIVGKGGQAEVYKGILSDGRLVAVKRLTADFSGDIKEKEFLSELGILGHVSHQNTIVLVGFCVENGLHLILEYSAYGNVSALLHDGGNEAVLEWSIRYKVAVGTARGLQYLHSGCPRRIVHRDIKASNILLGDDFEPQISDFGLAKWLPGNCDQLNVFPVEGTFGYLAPEYFMHGIVTEKTDVFAFGVLLLELITGRQPIDAQQLSLVMWAKPLLESSSVLLNDLADPRLAGAFDSRQMQRVVMAASLCVQCSAISRPNMTQVLELLSSGVVEESLAGCAAAAADDDDTPPAGSRYYHLPHPRHHHRSVREEDEDEEEYNRSGSSDYINDLCRHRKLALESEGPFHL